MLRTTQDVVEIRHWAELRAARPCREPRSGSLLFALPGVPCDGQEVGWDEFESTFMVTRAVCVYDDAPGACRCFVGAVADAQAFVARECGVLLGAPPA